jgi:hypothetical protein
MQAINGTIKDSYLHLATIIVALHHIDQMAAESKDSVKGFKSPL